ncbi:hypothetical protein P7C70_g3372, partial [Phenoliferia sp. Uapishka_3]
MGRALQQTSVSTNIKERLDFSCAIFAPNGDLIANVSDFPLASRADDERADTPIRRFDRRPTYRCICTVSARKGSMSFAVRYQINLLKGDINAGDVILSNHPVAGGSHLPDITCITPVFQEGKIVFFTASRGHHADVGGILPGSMPPTSKTIFEEGAQIKSFKVVREGVFQRDELVRYLVEEPAKYEGCSGTRCLGDVESDLRAQIAANNKGVGLIYTMVDEYSLQTVQDYMLHIRDNAELAVRNLLRGVAKTQGTTELHSVDYLDDGTPIALHVSIDAKKGSAVFDFEGTGAEIFGNLNAPVSVTYSAIIYCLRAMVDQDFRLKSSYRQAVVSTHPRPLQLSVVMSPIQCSILSERRVYHPYGLHGGGDGACGQNTWIKQPRAADGDLSKSGGAPRRVNLGGKATLRMGKGDRIVICTPGGGAWGAPGGEKKVNGVKELKHGRGDARGGGADRAAEQLGA